MQTRSCLFFLIIVLLLSFPSHPYAASVQLNWQPNTEPDIQSYNVYYGIESRSYNPPIPVENSTAYTLSWLEEGTTYFFAVTAVDTSGNESGYSEEISKQITTSDQQPPTISITSPTSESTYSVSTISIALAGTASDDHNIAQITWSSSNGESGSANGTTSWSIESLGVVEGLNTITVTATDSSGNTAQDSLTVTYTPPAAVIGLPVVSVTSSGDDGNVAANTIDNDLSTRWSSYGSGQWIQYDLGSYHTISDILIAFFLGDERTADFEVFVSDDAASWRSVFRGQSSGATQQQEVFSLANANGRYVRVVGYGNSNSAWVSYTEIDIRGVATNVPDNTSPTVNILSPTQDETFETSSVPSILLSGSAVDDNGVVDVSWSSSTGGSGTALGTESWSTAQINLLEGSNTITISAKDAAGNIGIDILTVVYTAPDTISPEVKITVPVESGTYTTSNATITLAGTAIDNEAVNLITWDSANGVSGTASGTDSWSASDIQLTEGPNLITVTATDSNGNQASDSITVTYRLIDTQAPSVSITSPNTSSGEVLKTTQAFIVISGTAQDDQDIMQVSWSLGNGNTSGLAEGTANWTTPAITLSEGLNTITVKAEDAAGNVGSAELRVEFALPDSIAPAVTITSPTDSDTFINGSTIINLAGTASDNSGLAQIVWNNSSTGQSGTASGTDSWNISGIQLAEGQNLLTVTATDVAGNTATDSITVILTAPDTQAPTIVIITPTDSGTFISESARIDIAGTARDDRELDRITWTASNGLNGTASGTTSWSISGINLAEGDTVITVTASDRSGNTASKILTIHYTAQDAEAPTVKIISPTTKSSFFSRTSKITVSGTASDNAGVTKVVWRNSRGESGTCSGTNNWQTSGILLNRWWNTITVTAIDNAGNSSQQALKVFCWK